LSADDLLLGTVELRVNTEVLTCDVMEFEQRIAADDLEAATCLRRAVSRRRVFRTRPSSRTGWNRTVATRARARRRPRAISDACNAAQDHVRGALLASTRGLAPTDSRAARG
jgi:hypothetical protein